jgi:hypothetical protein
MNAIKCARLWIIFSVETCRCTVHAMFKVRYVSFAFIYLTRYLLNIDLSSQEMSRQELFTKPRPYDTKFRRNIAKFRGISRNFAKVFSYFAKFRGTKFRRPPYRPCYRYNFSTYHKICQKLSYGDNIT